LDAPIPGSEKPYTSAEIRRGLLALFVGTAALGLLALALPVLQGLQQGLLALLLFLIPSWALKGSGKTIDDMGVSLGPWPRTLVVSGVCMVLVYPLFAWGFHAFHTHISGAKAHWSLERLERFDEALLDAPQGPCAADRAVAQAWIAGEGLWIIAPSSQELVIDLGSTPSTVRRARCREGTPHAGPARSRDGGQVRVPPGAGMWLSLKTTSAFTLRVLSEGEDLPRDKLLTGARSESVSDDGELTGSRDWTWIIAYLIVHLGIVALPEEWFFRGYLQTRLDERWGTPWSFLGAELGWGFIASALLFALLHPILLPGFHRLLVFFPALLFGYLRARTGNIGSAVMIHATSNLLLAILVGMYSWP